MRASRQRVYFGMGVSGRRSNRQKGAGRGYNEAPGTAAFWSDSGELIQLTPDKMKLVTPVTS